MQSIPSLLPSTIRAAAFSRVFSALRTRKGSLPLCGVLAFVLGGAWVGVHAQTAHFFEAQSVIANAANNGLKELLKTADVSQRRNRVVITATLSPSLLTGLVQGESSAQNSEAGSSLPPAK